MSDDKRYLSTYYFCDDDKETGYHKTFRVSKAGLPVRLQDKDNYNLMDETRFMETEDGYTMTMNGIVHELTQHLKNQKRKPVTVIKMILLKTA